MNATTVLKTIINMLAAPVRIRRHPPTPPTGREHYEPSPLAVILEQATLTVADIPVAKTPPGGYVEWPAPVLVGCDEPLVDGAPDLRGVWQAYKGPLKGHVERVEQAGNRVVITAGSVIHDMVADGTLEGVSTTSARALAMRYRSPPASRKTASISTPATRASWPSPATLRATTWSGGGARGRTVSAASPHRNSDERRHH